MLIPAALGGVLTRANAAAVRAPIVVEAANAPIEPDADAIFDARGVIVLPDILVNAGGVTASWFEWVQNRQHYQWGINRVRQELDRILGEAFEQVWQLSTSREGAAPHRRLHARRRPRRPRHNPRRHGVATGSR